MIPSADFLNFLRQCYDAMAADKSLTGASAWNPYGQSAATHRSTTDNIYSPDQWEPVAVKKNKSQLNYTHTHTHLTALCPGLPRWAATTKVKPIWILLEQETVSGIGISWAVCKPATRSRQITTPAPTTQFFTGRMPFLPPNQQCQSTEGTKSQLT